MGKDAWRRILKHYLSRGWAAVLAVPASAAVGLQLRDWPTEKFWNDWAWLSVAAVLVVAAVAILEPLYSAWEEAHVARKKGLEKSLDSILKGALVKVDQATCNKDLPWHAIGLHVWEVDKRWRYRPAHWLYRSVQDAGGPLKGGEWPLNHIASHHRLGHDQQTTQIPLVVGKGVAGQACQYNLLVARDLYADFYPFKDVSPNCWEEQPSDFRLNMSWGELQRCVYWSEHQKGKTYGGVVAVPFTDLQGSVLGCLSVDGPPGSFDTLTKEGIHEIIQDAANVVALNLDSRV